MQKETFKAGGGDALFSPVQAIPMQRHEGGDLSCFFKNINSKQNPILKISLNPKDYAV